MQTSLSERLRYLQERNNWTVANMAERTGIPKRTLDKYLLRAGASLPGFEGLCSLSKGLGVSLDWLVFGADAASEPVELIADKAADTIGRMFFAGLLNQGKDKSKRETFFSAEAILGLTPEEWAADMGLRAGEEAAKLIRDGTTRGELLHWREARKERMMELLSDRVGRETLV